MIWLILLLLLDRLLSRWSKLFWSTDRMSSIQEHIVARDRRIACLEKDFTNVTKNGSFFRFSGEKIYLWKFWKMNRKTDIRPRIFYPSSNIFDFGLLINQPIWIKQKCSKFIISWCFIVYVGRRFLIGRPPTESNLEFIASLKLTWPGKESRWLP